ncbi:MAG: calcium-binding protein [Pseudomonadota bacterium]
MSGTQNGTGGNNQLYDTATQDYIYGLGGNDTVFAFTSGIDIGGGVDQFFGGSGIDRISYEFSIHSVVMNLASGWARRTISEGVFSQTDVLTSFEEFWGSDLGDSFFGSDTSDTINALDGDDTIYSEGGNDNVTAGGGNDTVYSGDNADSVFGGNGSDSIFGESGNDTLRGQNGEDTISGGSGRDLIYGGNHDDHITGGDGQDTIFGQDGDDRAFGNGGADSIVGGLGDDSLSGFEAADTLRGDEGNDSLFGGNGADELRGGTGDDSIVGGAGIDTVIYDFADGVDIDLSAEWAWGVSAGSDTLKTVENVITGSGEDFVIGHNGANVLELGGNDDVAFGEGGSDDIYMGSGADTASGGNGSDTIRGGLGTDVLVGDAGADSLMAGGGDDTLFGGRGGDTLNGGGGANIFGFIEGSDGVDIIEDFTPGVDKLMFMPDFFAFEVVDVVQYDFLLNVETDPGTGDAILRALTSEGQRKIAQFEGVDAATLDALIVSGEIIAGGPVSPEAQLTDMEWLI